MAKKSKAIVVFGAGGVLGKELREAFKYRPLFFFDKGQVDITDAKSVEKELRRHRPAIVINAAAYTHVDACEQNLRHAMRVNGAAVGHIAGACRRAGAIMVHISTDYVFDGKKNGYREDSHPNPINAYGRSKKQGEDHVLALSQYYLIRTSWLFGKGGKNFVHKILDFAKTKEEISIVDDQFGRPTYAKDLAKGIKKIIDSKKPYGIYHLTNSGTCSWFEFAKEIKKIRKLKIRVSPVKTKDLALPTRRPRYCVLLNTKVKPMRHWRIALKEFLGSQRT